MTVFARPRSRVWLSGEAQKVADRPPGQPALSEANGPDCTGGGAA